MVHRNTGIKKQSTYQCYFRCDFTFIVSVALINFFLVTVTSSVLLRFMSSLRSAAVVDNVRGGGTATACRLYLQCEDEMSGFSVFTFVVGGEGW